LKRAERPPQEFWTRFESELRAKQLAAIVARRPWWAGYARFFGAVARHPLPVGAAAALAFSILGYQGYQLAAHRRSIGPVDDSSRLAQAALPAEDASAYAAEDAEDAAAASSSIARPSGAVLAANRAMDSAAPAALRDNPPAAGRENSFDAGWPGRTLSPSARSIAVNLATAQAADPQIGRNFLSLSRTLDAGLVPERRRVTEPLARMVSPSAERRARLLADALPAVANSGDATVPSSEHFVSRLSDDRLYESISRYAAGDGGNFAIKVKF
jgi:hypothetical protein